MKIMLDTNVCIYIIKKRPLSVLGKLQSYSISDICISSITLSELEYGIFKSQYPEKNKLALTEFVTPLEILPFDDLAAHEYGLIRAYLEKKMQIIGHYDLLIAAHALSKKLTLVTNNIREFKRVPHLKLENWV